MIMVESKIVDGVVLHGRCRHDTKVDLALPFGPCKQDEFVAAPLARKVRQAGR